MEIAMDKELAKSIPISEILGKLNSHPTRINGNKALYSSPLRNEKTPSFWVNQSTNRWYDFGEPAGGDLIDFVRMYLKSCNEADTLFDALRWIKNMSENSYVPALPVPKDELSDDNSSLTIKSIKPVRHLGLVQYLAKRGISLVLARKHLHEIHVHNKATSKSFYVLGFKNGDGGYELRNPFFQGSAKPKTISFVRATSAPSKRIHIFEGFMDYLSAVSRLGTEYPDGDSIILNSIACLSKAYPYIRNYGYRIAHSWMDNDIAGANASRLLSAFLKTEQDIQHIRMNNLYAPYKDVNEWHVAMSSPTKPI
ncbi:toprim domain-containing protein [Dyadobacter sp. LJ53]|uniref:toprim domain-containing protein n=1 Tax=Dyadobacter chenwenxiniae TaxID=2906456 RepID=UPI001F1D95D2|nr:toprim domain-containing protein [Dyadobacter chenwenxiniae]MCF0049542.1 toprim domain-containing protein [Dyadobacter chenwenxiniae]